MKRKILNTFKIFVLAICLLTLTGCGNPESVTIDGFFDNQSAVLIENVVFVSGADQVELGSIKPGEERSEKLTFYNAEGVNIKYTQNGQRYDFRLVTDFDKDYKNAKAVTITYGPDKNGIETFWAETEQNFNIAVVLIPTALAVVIGVLVVALLKIKKKNTEE